MKNTIKDKENIEQEEKKMEIQLPVSLRDWFAGQVLPELIGGAGMEDITKAAYKWADAMIKARENKDE